MAYTQAVSGRSQLRTQKLVLIQRKTHARTVRLAGTSLHTTATATRAGGRRCCQRCTHDPAHLARHTTARARAAKPRANRRSLGRGRVSHDRPGQCAPFARSRDKPPRLVLPRSACSVDKYGAAPARETAHSPFLSLRHVVPPQSQVKDREGVERTRRSHLIREVLHVWPMGAKVEETDGDFDDTA